MIKWFLKTESQILGPFSTEQIENQHNSGEIPESYLIWGRPQSEWRNLDWWRQELTGLIRISASVEEQRWHYAMDQQSIGPMSRSQLVDEVADIDDKTRVLVWTDGMDEWTPIYQLPDLMESIGLKMRKFPRAPIAGSVIINDGEKDIITQLQTISEGGCGIKAMLDFHIGQKVNLMIKSESIYRNISTKAEVRYKTSSGQIGLEFIQIHQEAKSAIIEYIRLAMKDESLEEELQVA